MTLIDCKAGDAGRVIALGGDIPTRRRLADIGLLGSEFSVRAVNESSLLADFGALSAVVELALAANIEVLCGAE